MSSNDRTAHKFICSECGATRTIYGGSREKAIMTLFNLKWVAHGNPYDPAGDTTYKCPRCGQADRKKLQRDGEKF